MEMQKNQKMHVFKSKIAKILPKMAYFSSFFPRLLFLARNSSYRNSSFLVSHRGIDQPNYGTIIFNILDNTTELWMTKYKNPSDQTVQWARKFKKVQVQKKLVKSNK